MNFIVHTKTKDYSKFLHKKIEKIKRTKKKERVNTRTYTFRTTKSKDE